MSMSAYRTLKNIVYAGIAAAGILVGASGCGNDNPAGTASIDSLSISESTRKVLVAYNDSVKSARNATHKRQLESMVELYNNHVRKAKATFEADIRDGYLSVQEQDAVLGEFDIAYGVKNSIEDSLKEYGVRKEELNIDRGAGRLYALIGNQRRTHVLFVADLGKELKKEGLEVTIESTPLSDREIFGNMFFCLYGIIIAVSAIGAACEGGAKLYSSLKSRYGCKKSQNND